MESIRTYGSHPAYTLSFDGWNKRQQIISRRGRFRLGQSQKSDLDLDLKSGRLGQQVKVKGQNG